MNNEQREVAYDLLVGVAEELAARDLHIQHLKDSRRDSWRLLKEYIGTMERMSLWGHLQFWFRANYLRRVTDTERQAYYNLRDLFTRR